MARSVRYWAWVPFFAVSGWLAPRDVEACTPSGGQPTSRAPLEGAAFPKDAAFLVSRVRASQLRTRGGDVIALKRVRRLQSLQSNGGVNADILRPSSPLLVGEEYGLELEDAAVVRFWVTDEIPTVRVSLTLQLEEIVASEPRRLTSAECYEAPLTERTYSHAVKLTLHAGRDVPLIMVATTHDATSDTELEETTGSLDALPADRRRAVALFPATDRRRALPTGRGHRLRRALAVRPNRLLCGRRASHPRHRGRRLRSELAADCAD